MTKTNALKAPCPYQPRKLCVADKCPKWRWESIKKCAELHGRPLFKCIEIRAFWEEIETSQSITGSTDPDTSFCTDFCPYRVGYCS